MEEKTGAWGKLREADVAGDGPSGFPPRHSLRCHVGICMADKCVANLQKSTDSHNIYMLFFVLCRGFH